MEDNLLQNKFSLALATSLNHGFFNLEGEIQNLK